MNDNETKVEVALDMLTDDMINETGLDETTANIVVSWLVNEGAVDYAAILETYDPVI